MPKLPSTPPNSDLDGVHEDARPNTDAALESGQDASNLELTRSEAAGRPARSKEKSRDNRSR